jgi:hypothetical protein
MTLIGRMAPGIQAQISQTPISNQLIDQDHLKTPQIKRGEEVGHLELSASGLG